VILRERTVGPVRPDRPNLGEVFRRLFGGNLQVGVGASFPSEFDVLRLHVALLFHLMHLQLELAAVADELR
jgi:hypothetical protein